SLLLVFVFYLTHTSLTFTYPLSLHDALPILYLSIPVSAVYVYFFTLSLERDLPVYSITVPIILIGLGCTLFLVYRKFSNKTKTRSEEHTSELQSRENLVCRLLLEKKKKKQHN